MVNDLTGFLSSDEINSLEAKLRGYLDTTSTQIYIAIVPDLLGYDKSDFAIRLAEKWKVGQKGKNNGILILVKPKTAMEKGEVFIAVGYGLEDVIPDITANKYIVNRDIIPNFKQNRFYQGLDEATTTIMGLASGKFTADQYNKRKATSGGGAGAIIFIIIIIVLVLIFKGNSRNRGNTMGGSSLPFWLALGMLSSGSRSSGGFGGFSSGSGGFGGFGGGGGGSFGGGGAGGNW
jgi:uncharacterized protein